MINNNLNTKTTIKVMSYNIRRSKSLLRELPNKHSWFKRRTGLVSQIQNYSPDVFGLQEAMPAQVKYIEKKLSRYACVSLGRDGKNTGEACAIFYKPERFEVLFYDTFWLSETPYLPSKYQNATCKRICTYIKAKDKITYNTFLFLNTHLDNRSKEAREFGATKMLEIIDTCNNPVILSGDFNDTEQSDVYKLFRAILNDAAKIVADSVTRGTFHGFTGKAEPCPIDFIFASKEFSVDRYSVIAERGEKGWFSDHFPIIAELSY